MKQVNNTATSSGVGFTGLLTIVFIVLKLTHVINWTWFWVLSPIWMPMILFLVVLLIAVIAAGIKGGW